MNNFDKLYNLIMESLTHSLSDKQMNVLKTNIDDFLNSIRDNETLKETNIVPTDRSAKDELSDNISDTLLFGSNKNIKDGFLKIIKPLKLNFTENIINDLLMLATTNKKDYKNLILFLNDRNNNGLDLTEQLTLNEIADKTRFIFNFY